jgi:hypothetical protein
MSSVREVCASSGPPPNGVRTLQQPWRYPWNLQWCSWGADVKCFVLKQYACCDFLPATIGGHLMCLQRPCGLSQSLLHNMGAPASTLLGTLFVWWWPCIELMHAFIALHLL